MKFKKSITHRVEKKKHAIIFVAIVLFFIFTFICLLSFSVLNVDQFLHSRDIKNRNVQTFTPVQESEVQKYIPPYHRFVPGESISEIALSCGVSWSEIVRFNNIVDVRNLREGDRLYIPSGIKRLINNSSIKEIYHKPSRLPGIITIGALQTKGVLPFGTRFFSRFDFSNSLFPVWDLGNGRFSMEKQPFFTYLKSGTYNVKLSLADYSGTEVFSNTLTLTVDPVNIASDTDKFFTLNHVGETLDLSDRFFDDSGKPVVFDTRYSLYQDPVLIKYFQPDRFLAIKPGYARIFLASDKDKTAGNTIYSFYLFVSPFPTQHSVEPEFNWYKTQFDTGMYGNCGPACVAMAVHWSTGKAISVEESREEIGLPIKSGALSYHHMVGNFRFHNIRTHFRKIRDFKDVKNIIDSGHIAIILFNTTYIQPVIGDESKIFVDRYYPDTTGHYVVIKGYTLDKKYFVVYDPIPGDWQTNSIRYSDGVSMIGRNRYFLVDQIFQSIKGKDILEIERKTK